MRFEYSWMECVGEDEPERGPELELDDVLVLGFWDFLLDLRVRSSSFAVVLGDIVCCERRPSSEGEGRIRGLDSGTDGEVASANNSAEDMGGEDDGDLDSDLDDAELRGKETEEPGDRGEVPEDNDAC